MRSAWSRYSDFAALAAYPVQRGAHSYVYQIGHVLLTRVEGGEQRLYAIGTRVAGDKQAGVSGSLPSTEASIARPFVRATVGVSVELQTVVEQEMRR